MKDAHAESNVTVPVVADSVQAKLQSKITPNAESVMACILKQTGAPWGVLLGAARFSGMSVSGPIRAGWAQAWGVTLGRADPVWSAQHSTLLWLTVRIAMSHVLCWIC